MKGEAGDDLLIGGAGNDSLTGGAGSDIYYFERSWGQDTIYNSGNAAGDKDAILFAQDISPQDISLKRDSISRLVIELIGSTDKITVANYFYQDGKSSYALHEIKFADGTVWDIEKVKAMTGS